MPLRSSIQQLAEQFATRVLEALSRSSLAELALVRGPTTPSRKTPTTPAKRSAPNSGPTIDAIVQALRGAKSGMRNEHLQAALRTTKTQLQRPIREALASNRIRKTGQRRGTTYFAR